VFANFKAANTIELSAGIAFGAEAELFTVVGSVDDATIIGVVESAREHSKSMVVDAIGAENWIKCA
jgi:3-hexulose-6-phosphate synthase